MPSRRQMIMGVVGTAAGAALAGCTSAAGANSKTRWAQPGSSLAPGGVPVTVPVDVTFTPAANASDSTLAPSMTKTRSASRALRRPTRRRSR